MKNTSTSTGKEYIKRINTVLDFIEKNLDSDLSLELLSKKAHYSLFHFHRIFTTVVGENLNVYISRKRIERIAGMLLTSHTKPIKELAYSYGFKSESSFSRAFKKYYGVSPTRFKTEGKSVLSKIGIEPFDTEDYICDIDECNKWMKVNSKITIRKLQDIKLAGINHIGDFEKMNSLYQRLMSWASENDVLDSSNFKAITIYHDNPHVTEISKVRYSACITVSDDVEAYEEIRPLSISEGVYAVGRFEVLAEEISLAWKNLNIWVMENGYKFRDGDFFEIYHNDHNIHPESKFILDICMPLEETATIKVEHLDEVKFNETLNPKSNPQLSLGYHELVGFMKELRTYFYKAYTPQFALGKINQGSKDYTYFSLTPQALKRLKLKFVIVYNHVLNGFTICLSGQNKSIRKNYWYIFKGSDWSKYPLVESIDENLMIVYHNMVEHSDFGNKENLMNKIEKASVKFMNDLMAVLE